MYLDRENAAQRHQPPASRPATTTDQPKPTQFNLIAHNSSDSSKSSTSHPPLFFSPSHSERPCRINPLNTSRSLIPSSSPLHRRLSHKTRKLPKRPPRKRTRWRRRSPPTPQSLRRLAGLRQILPRHLRIRRRRLLRIQSRCMRIRRRRRHGHGHRRILRSGLRIQLRLRLRLRLRPLLPILLERLIELCGQRAQIADVLAGSNGREHLRVVETVRVGD